MAAPTITQQPTPQTVVSGQNGTFSVAATGDNLSYQWKENDQDIPGATSVTYSRNASIDDNNKKYKVVVSNTEGSAISNEVTLTVIEQAPLLYDPNFAKAAALALTVAVIVILLPILIVAFRTAGESGATIPKFPGTVSIQLVIVGVFVIAGVLYLALLEFRGRSRTIEEMAPPEEPEATEGFSLTDVLTNVPAILRSLSDMKIVSALVVLAIVCFVSAAAVSWRALPQPDATPTPSPSPTTQPTPTPTNSQPPPTPG